METVVSSDLYRKHCENESSIPLFSQAWWLDAVAGAGQWSAVVAMRGDKMAGALPYIRERRVGLTVLTQPPLTQTLGPWLPPSQAKYAKTMAAEKAVLGALADGLPWFDFYRQNWHWNRTNWLPFYWRGFSQTTRYTYRLELKDEQAAWAGLQENIRTEIRKAQKRFEIRIREANNLDEFLELNGRTFERQDRPVPYPNVLVQRLDQAARDRSARDVLVAEAPDGKLHAGVYIVRDANTAYYIMGGSDPVRRNSGAGSLCLWTAIQSQPEHIEIFDFEGSMLESIERFFRAFGAEQIPYFRITKATTFPARVAECWKRLGSRD